MLNHVPLCFVALVLVCWIGLAPAGSPQTSGTHYSNVRFFFLLWGPSKMGVCNILWYIICAKKYVCFLFMVSATSHKIGKLKIPNVYEELHNKFYLV